MWCPFLIMHLHLDFETYSSIDLKKRGLDVYARHESTKVLMLAYGTKPERIRLWLPHETPMPEHLSRWLADPNVTLAAHNAQFERNIFEHTLGVRTDASRWQCTMVMALSLGLPSALGTLVSSALALPKKFHKDADGERLMRMFSFPSSKATHESHPDEFEAYTRYCVQDVVAEMKVYDVLSRYLEGQDELNRRWCLDQKINATGLPVDTRFVRDAKDLSKEAKSQYMQQLKQMTGLANPNSTSQMLGWLTERGYPFTSLQKDRVAVALSDFGHQIEDEAKEVIAVRAEMKKTSVSKYDALERCAVGGRLRNTFQFRGAAATGRYAGRILGQNLPRPWRVVEPYLREARNMIAERDLDALDVFFGRPLDVLASSIRSAIKAPKGKKLVVADLSSIELCVIAWWTECRFWLDVVESGKDAYKAFGSRWLKVPYDEVTKAQRSLSKPPALGCGYRMGAGREVGEAPDIVKTGLWGYAENMGVDMSKEQCKEAVKLYRDISPEIVNAWYALDEAAMSVVTDGAPRYVCGMKFERRSPFLRIRLPSGRYLHYCRPRIEQVTMEYEDQKTGKVVRKKKQGLTYQRLTTNRKWGRFDQHGGRFAEQITQAIALDVLDLGLEAADKHGFEVVGHYHDEVVTMVDENSDLGLPELIECLTAGAPWTAGLTLRAAGYENDFYRKD